MLLDKVFGGYKPFGHEAPHRVTEKRKRFRIESHPNDVLSEKSLMLRCAAQTRNTRSRGFSTSAHSVKLTSLNI
jgi:hypothetical protein